MRADITVALTREDGDHVARVEAVFEVDPFDDAATIMVSALAGSEVVEALVALIQHDCGGNDRPVQLGDARN